MHKFYSSPSARINCYFRSCFASCRPSGQMAQPVSDPHRINALQLVRYGRRKANSPTGKSDFHTEMCSWDLIRNSSNQRENSSNHTSIINFNSVTNISFKKSLKIFSTYLYKPPKILYYFYIESKIFLNKNKYTVFYTTLIVIDYH